MWRQFALLAILLTLGTASATLATNPVDAADSTMHTEEFAALSDEELRKAVFLSVYEGQIPKFKRILEFRPETGLWLDPYNGLGGTLLVSFRGGHGSCLCC
jgi:hypothetical protein